MFSSLQLCGLHHTRLPCPSLYPWICPHLCLFSRWCHPTISFFVVPFSSFLPSIFPSIKVFSNESVLHIRWPKYWSFSFSISASNECSGLISFWNDWFDLAVQGTLKSILQHHNSKALILGCAAFCMVQPSHLYMTTGKIVALTIQSAAGKVIYLLFNALFSFVIGEGNGNPL